MIVFLIIALGALIVVDVRQAYGDYQKDKNAPKLAFHGVLLLALGFIVVNTAFAAMDAEYNLPFIEVQLVVRRPHPGPGKHWRLASMSKALHRLKSKG